MLNAALFQIIVASVGSCLGAALAIQYFRTVSLDRPPIGVFGPRDLIILGCFIVLLPLIYVHVTAVTLTSIVVVTFYSAVMIALRPVVTSTYLRLWVMLVLILAIMQARYVHAMPGGLQVYWAITSVVVFIAALGVANLYVQGGLGLKAIAWFALFLGIYDIVFTRVIPLTPQLAVALQGRPLDPSIGFALGSYNANVGLGDLLVFCLYSVAAYREFGRRGAVTAIAVIVVFGAVAPSIVPLLAPGLFGTTAAAFVPVQTLFGPPAFVSWLILSRRGRERSVREWAALGPVSRARPTPTRRPMATTAAVAMTLMLGVAVWSSAGATARARTSVASSEPKTGVVRIAMRNVAFSTRSISVRPGTIIEWTNEDPVAHNVVSGSGPAIRSGLIAPGQTFTYRVTGPGVITYECTLHQGMIGRIVVTR